MLLVITAAFFGSNPRTSVRRNCGGCAAGDATSKVESNGARCTQCQGGGPSRRRDRPCFILWHDPINNDFTVVDEVKKEKGGTATFFVKSGDKFVRVSTNVQKADGSRAIGTLLDPKGKVIEAIAQDKSYFGEANILGKDYVTGYEPIHNASNNIIGIYYVGYLK